MIDERGLAAEISLLAAQRAIQAERDAHETLRVAVAMAHFAATGEGDPPTAAEMDAVSRATHARENGQDKASRMLRACRARIAISRGRAIAGADLAAAAGVSRQYVYREYGSRVEAADARDILNRAAERSRA